METEGGWATNQMRATARLAVVRSRWSLDYAKKLTILDISRTVLCFGRVQNARLVEHRSPNYHQMEPLSANTEGARKWAAFAYSHR